MAARILLVAALLALSACASVEVGRKFDLASFDSRVQRGVTTRAEVEAWLGAPSAVGEAVEASGERYEQWTYYHASGRMPGLKDAKLQMLQVKFDLRGVVRAYNWSGQR
jgi:outer membrane protein assembly factor BamE (lipoprotein component of BamABCDE complex)